MLMKGVLSNMTQTIRVLLSAVLLFFVMTKNSLKTISFFPFFLSFLILPIIVFAEKMDLETHNLVIEKLETTLLSLSSSDQSVNASELKLQLANLYSEKSRLLLIEEGQLGCQNCKKSVEFKNKAIRNYESLISKLKGQDLDTVSLQLAHLLESTNRSKEALQIYNSLIKKNKSEKKILSHAYSKRAANSFASGNFDQAMEDYSVVLKLSTPEDSGLVQHKIAWVYFNKGDIDLAIKKLVLILKNKNLLLQPTENGYQYSEAFHIEVAHDLALFMAKENITEENLNKLISLSPKNEVISNLITLGDESDRLGQPEGAANAWEKALQTEGFPETKKKSVLLSIARYHRDNKRYKKANDYFKQTLLLTQKTSENVFTGNKCDSSCLSQAKSLKQFLAQWEKQATKHSNIESIQLSQNLLIQAYDIYHSFHVKDFESYLWKAQLAQKMKKFETARMAYATAADILVGSLESKTKLQRKELEKLLNSALLAEIAMAETEINTSPSKIQSYDHYLKINFNGTENNKVRYQKAKLFYDTNQLAQAIELFDQIVHDSNFKNKDLKLKSANLALDSLVILKNIKDLESKAIEYSTLLLDQAPQFHQISRNAGLKIVQEIASQNQTVNNSEKAFEKFETVTQKSMTPEEFKNHLKLKIDLSLKAQKLIVAQQSLSQFINLKDISVAERRWALLKKLAIAELLLDFKQAYELVLRLNFSQSNQPAELLKGALLAELNKMNASVWLEKIIRSPKSTKQQVNLARGQLVRFAKFPWKALHQQVPFIGNQPNLISDLALECFSRDANISEAQWALNLRGIKLTDSGFSLQRILSIIEIQNIEKSLKKEKLNSRTDNLLAASLRIRIKNISEIKKSLRQAQRKQDWTLQVYSASVLKKENDRLSQEIELLPIPKKLNSQDKIAYSNELLNQAKPFREASKELQLFLDFTWQDPTYISSLLNRIESQVQIRNVLMIELRSLASVAPAKTLNDIQNKLAEFKVRPIQKEISETQSKLRNEPFDISLQNQLFVLEKKIGNQSMAVFLQARSDSLKGGPL